MSWKCLYILLPAVLLFAAACSRKKDKEKIDWSVSLNRSKKTPYGAALAYETLPRYFPAARREPLSSYFRYTAIDEHMYGTDSSNMLVLLGLSCYVTDEEWNALLKFVNAGNEVFVLSSNLDVHLARALHCRKISSGGEEAALTRYNDGSVANKTLRLVPDSARSYGYNGRSIASYFETGQRYDGDTLPEEGNNELLVERSSLEEEIDTAATVLGTAPGGPNFLRYRVGTGHITLHAAPLVLSNYFLLQQGNRSYLDSIWHSFPANISVIYWNEYFKRSTKSSSLSILLKYPATRWALIIAACTLLLYVLFGFKRLQRIVPIMPPVENASVSFVETVGRLYFNKGNHANLAEKMIQHFLEWVRSHYYLDTSQINDTFTQQLTAKSGKTEEEVTALINRIHHVRLGAAVTPEYLYELHQIIQSFYNAH